MPVTGPEELPDRQTPLLGAGGESVKVSAILLGAYKFPTTDSRDDVGFLGSLPLSPRTKSKPVTPLSPAPLGTALLAYRLRSLVSFRYHRTDKLQAVPSTRHDVGRGSLPGFFEAR